MATWMETKAVNGRFVRTYLLEAQSIYADLVGVDGPAKSEAAPELTLTVVGIAAMLQIEHLFGARPRAGFEQPNRG